MCWNGGRPKPLKFKRLELPRPLFTGLKPGVNEMARSGCIDSNIYLSLESGRKNRILKNSAMRTREISFNFTCCKMTMEHYSLIQGRKGFPQLYWVFFGF